MLSTLSSPATSALEGQSFAIVDVETTGIDPARDRVVEVAVVRLEPDGSDSTYSTLVNPGRPIPSVASDIHGITDRDVVDAPPLAALGEVLREMTAGAIVVAHVARFDRSFLHELHDRRWLCTLRLARRLFPHAPRFTNVALREYLRISDERIRGRRAHRALTDALITRHVLAACLERWSGYEGNSVDELLDFSERPMRGRTFWFGKYRGVPLSSVPESYLAWILSDRGITDNDIRHLALGELDVRRSRAEQRAVPA